MVGDEYLPFYFKYVLPNLRTIKQSASSRLFKTLTTGSLDSWMGSAFGWAPRSNPAPHRPPAATQPARARLPRSQLPHPIHQMQIAAYLAPVLTLLAALVLASLLLPRYFRRARERRLWTAILEQVEARGIALCQPGDLQGLDPIRTSVLTASHPTLVHHANAGVTRVELTVGEQQHARVKRSPPPGFRAHSDTDDLLGYVRKPDHAAILAERRRILGEEVPKVEAARQRHYQQCEVPCQLCDGSGHDEEGGPCAGCGGVGRTINTAMLDNLPAMPQVPLPVDAVRVVFLYRA